MTTLSPKMLQRRNRVMGIVFLVFAMAILAFFVPSTKSGQMTTFVFDVSRGEALPIGSSDFCHEHQLIYDGCSGRICWSLAAGERLQAIHRSYWAW